MQKELRELVGTSTSNNWKLVQIHNPGGCMVEDGFAVAWAIPGVNGVTLVPARYSGYMLACHALSVCNTLNIKGVHVYCGKLLGEIYRVPRKYVFEVK